MQEGDSIEKRHAAALSFLEPFSKAIEQRLSQLQKPNDEITFGFSREGTTLSADVDLRNFVSNIHHSPVTLSSLGPKGGKVILRAAENGEPYFKFEQNDMTSMMDTSTNGRSFNRNGSCSLKPGETVYLCFQGVTLKIQTPTVPNWDTSQYARSENLNLEQIGECRKIVERIRVGDEKAAFELRKFLPFSVHELSLRTTYAVIIHPLAEDSWKLEQVDAFIAEQELSLSSIVSEPTPVVDVPATGEKNLQVVANALLRSVIRGAAEKLGDESPKLSDEELRLLVLRALANAAREYVVADKSSN